MADNLIEQINTLHAEFKSAIDRSDTAATERLNAAISEVESKLKAIEAAANRPAIDLGLGAKEAEYKAAFNTYLRNGDITEFKAMSGGTLSEGGYTVPKVIDSAITKALVDISPMRSIARVINVTTSDFRIPFSVGGTASSWIGEKAARTETAASTITEITPSFGEIYASPWVTPVLIEDSQFDIEGFVADEVSTEFARAEGAAFVSGDGSAKPKGFLSYTNVATADATRAFGSLQFVVSGAATSFTSDGIVNLVHTLKAGYRQNAVFTMSKAALGAVRTLRDSTGQYLWQPSYQTGTPSTLLGYRVVEMEDMPAIAASSYSIAFGDFNRGYVVADRVGVSMLRDPYSNAPYVAYKTRKRVGGALVDSSAIKLLKTST